MGDRPIKDDATAAPRASGWSLLDPSPRCGLRGWPASARPARPCRPRAQRWPKFCVQ